MVSGPSVGLLMPRLTTSALTSITGVFDSGTDYFDVDVRAEGNDNFAHWEAWLEFYDDTAGTSLVVPDDGDIDVLVSPTNKTGYADYLEALSDGNITMSGQAFTAGPRVTWAGRAGVIRFDVATPVDAGSSGAIYFRAYAWGYHS